MQLISLTSLGRWHSLSLLRAPTWTVSSPLTAPTVEPTSMRGASLGERKRVFGDGKYKCPMHGHHLEKETEKVESPEH